MNEPKTYTIGDKQWTIGKLSWRQRKLAAAFEQRLREQFVRMYELAKKKDDKKQRDKSPDLAGLFQVSIDLDALIYTDDGGLPVFLATILTPVGETFDEAMVAERSKQMEQIDEETIAEVISDFFSRTRSFIKGSMSAARSFEGDANRPSGSSSAQAAG